MRSESIKFSGDKEGELMLLERLVRQLPRERRIFTTQALCFLMVGHYLLARWSLSSGLEALLETGARKFLGKCKRVDNRKVSTNTSGISQARSALSLETLRGVLRSLLEQLKGHSLLWHGREVKTIDGSSELLRPLAGLRRAFPPTKNQFGESAYPGVQLTLLHDALSGLAEDYEMGPLNGDAKEGELEQSRRILSRLEPATVVIADRGYGMLQMVKHAQAHGLDVVYRLKAGMAKSILNVPLEPQMDCPVAWSPSKAELKAHPNWKAGESIKGRVITRTILREDKELFLVIFTTLDESFKAADIVELYGHRWEIENEIRDLKKTIGLSEISARTPGMIEKEVVAAIVAYNIIRAMILAAAKTHGIADPKRISFKSAFSVVQRVTLQLLDARTDDEREHLVTRALYWIAARVNKKRPGRSFPRKSYKKHSKYPSRRPDIDGVWA